MTLQAPSPPLVLASGSATRLAVLRAAGLEVEALAPSVDETAAKVSARAEGESAEAAALALAGLKAACIAARRPDAVVIGADQILVCEDRWFDKPMGLDAAREQLRYLRGREHGLATAAVCHRDGQAAWHHVTTPRLSMRSVSDAFIDRYVEQEGDVLLTSVGAYCIEGRGIQLFERIEGEHAAILGLPLLPLLGWLRESGVIRA